MHVAMATEHFLNNANGPRNRHAKFEIFLHIYENLQIKRFFHRFCIVGIFCQLPYKSMGKSLTFRIFIKTAVNQKRLKLCMVIPWTISIVKKVCCHSNMPAGIQFSITQLVYMWSCAAGMQ